MKLLLALLSVLAIHGAALFSPHPATMSQQPAAATPVPDALREAPDDGGLPPLEGSSGTVWRVHTDLKEIALTFDDGPYPFYTPVLLHVLDRSSVPATFFLVGRSAQEFPGLVERIVQSGDEIGNHTFNHYTLTMLSDDAIAEQIASDGALLRQFTGKPLSLFRPPHGHFNQRIVSIAAGLGYRTILWSDAANDAQGVPTDVITERVLSEASPGGIILLHSGQYRTIEALPDIIDGLRDEGYTFVTVSKLLEDGEAPHSL